MYFNILMSVHIVLPFHSFVFMS